MVGEETKNSAEDHNGEMALIQISKANLSLAVELACQIQACNWQRVEALITSVPGGEMPPVLMVAAEQTTLHLAVELNADPMIIQGLIKVMDMNEANKPDKKGNTPLHLCCRYSTQFQILGLLVEAWPDAVSHQNRRGHTPLDNLFMRDEEDDEAEDEPWNPVDATSVMLNVCPEAIDHVDRDGQTLLHRALRHGATPELIQSIPPLLLMRKPELVHIADKHLVTPLHEACKREDSLLIVQDLMARLTREQCMAKDNEGRTPLHYAIYWSSSVDVVQELVHAAYELIHVKDLKGKTPMDYLVSFYAPEFSSNHIQIGWNNSLYNVLDLV
jgi:ankyrin repeat protein